MIVTDEALRCAADPQWADPQRPLDHLYIEIAAQLLAARARIAALEADAKRLDWLEGEMDREQTAFRFGELPPAVSLFRRNLLITRAAIDAEREEQ